MTSKLSYFAYQSFASIRESKGVTLLTSSTIATCLLLVGLYAMTLENLERLLMQWGRAAHVSVYINDKSLPTTWEALRQQLASLDGVSQATLITPSEAIERFKARHPNEANLVEGVPSDVLQAAVELDVTQAKTLDEIKELAETAALLPDVAEVDYGHNEFVRLQDFITLSRTIGLLLGLILVLTTAFIVANTVRLTVYARRDEIGILRLVGATRAFVRTPFVLEGMLWGLAGGIAATSLLYVLDRHLAPHLTQAVAFLFEGLPVKLFMPNLGVGLVLAGMLLGVLGSALAVRRFLRTEVETV